MKSRSKVHISSITVQNGDFIAKNAKMAFSPYVIDRIFKVMPQQNLEVNLQFDDKTCERGISVAKPEPTTHSKSWL